MKKLDFNIQYHHQINDFGDQIGPSIPITDLPTLTLKVKDLCESFDKLNEDVAKIYKKLFSKKCDHIFRNSPFGEICEKCGWNNSMPPDPNDSIVED